MANSYYGGQRTIGHGLDASPFGGLFRRAATRSPSEPQNSDGALTIVALAQKAGVPRNALTQRHLDLRNDFCAQVKARGHTPDPEARRDGRPPGVRLRLIRGGAHRSAGGRPRGAVSGVVTARRALGQRRRGVALHRRGAPVGADGAEQWVGRDR